MAKYLLCDSLHGVFCLVSMIFSVAKANYTEWS
jgi:hypothetical protein